MSNVNLSAYPLGADANELAVHANHIVTSMTGNSHFPGAVSSVVILGGAKTDLLSAINAPMPESKVIKARFMFLQKALKLVKAWVEVECKNDELIALTSGFSLITSSKRPPQTFAAYQGQQSGTADLECAFAGKAAYVWEMTTDPIGGSIWQFIKITNTTIVQVKGLTPGLKYWFRVKAIVNDEEQAYSDPIMLHVI